MGAKTATAIQQTMKNTKSRAIIGAMDEGSWVGDWSLTDGRVATGGPLTRPCRRGATSSRQDAATRRH
jgi:hypothetical protein